MSDEDVYRKDWMSDGQWACANFLAAFFRGWHHVPTKIKECGKGIEINFRPHGMATYDFDNLTRLVLMAHDKMVRVDIQGSGPSMIKLMLHKRDSREGSMYERHPTIEDVLSQWREFNK